MDSKYTIILSNMKLIKVDLYYQYFGALTGALCCLGKFERNERKKDKVSGFFTIRWHDCMFLKIMFERALNPTEAEIFSIA